MVSDAGKVSCNRGRSVPIAAPDLLAARQLVRDLAPQARLGLTLPAGPAGRTAFRYRTETGDGHVAFADSSPQLPASFVALAAITRTLARGACGLPR